MDEGQKLYMQVYHLPGSEEAARARLEKLRNKAHGLGVAEIANRLDVVCNAWDREVRREQLYAAKRGEECSMGVDHG